MWYVNCCESVVNRCKAIVNHCESLQSHLRHISWIYSQGQKQKIWFLWVATVPENCCIVSDSLCHARLLLLSSITEFVISKITQTNFANQNLHRRKFGSLPCRITLQTRFVVFSRLWTQFVLSETTNCCSALKQPLMRGDWKWVCAKLFLTPLKPPNPDLKYN